MIQDSIFVSSTHRAPYEINILLTVGLFCFITDDIWFSIIHKSLQLNSIAFRGSHSHFNSATGPTPGQTLPSVTTRMHVMMSRGGDWMSGTLGNNKALYNNNVVIKPFSTFIGTGLVQVYLFIYLFICLECDLFIQVKTFSTEIHF